MTKKKSTKKAAKKVVKTAKKTVTRKPAEKTEEVEGKRMPLSRFVCQMLVDKVPDLEIVEAMKKDYPDKDCTQKTVSWYRFAINKGRMEKLGFEAPEGGLINSRRVSSEKKKAERASKRAEKEVVPVKTVKKVARRKTK